MLHVCIGEAVWKLSNRLLLYYSKKCCLKQKCFLTDEALSDVYSGMK